MLQKNSTKLLEQRTAGRFIGCATASLAAALVCSGAGASPSEPDPTLTRILHQSQQAARESVWKRLFPEGPTLADSVLVLTDELDDAHFWATRLSAHDRNTGEELSFGGFMPSGESASIPLEGGDGADEAPPLDAVSANGQVMSGLIYGPSGESRPVVGLRVQIDIASLASILPVRVDLFVPFEFPADELDADIMVLEAKLALASLTPEGDALGFGGPDPTGDPTALCRAAMADCVDTAWRSMMMAAGAAWAQTGIATSAALIECMSNATDDCDPKCRALGCLLDVGIDFAAAGDGSFAWTWAQRAHDVAACTEDAAACIEALPDGGGPDRPRSDGRGEVRPGEGSGS